MYSSRNSKLKHNTLGLTRINPCIEAAPATSRLCIIKERSSRKEARRSQAKSPLVLRLGRM